MEIWKDIPGFENIYQASNLGQIRSTPGKTTSNARYATRVWESRILKPKYGKRKGGSNKDARVSLWKNGEHKDFLVSRLVALAWVDGYEQGLTVNHIDGNPMNNSADNLEWISIAENIRHAFSTGLMSAVCDAVELTSADGVTLSFYSKSDASRFLGRNVGYISNVIKHGRLPTSASGQPYFVNERAAF